MYRLAFIYFAMVFAAGFALGTLRVTMLVPNLGSRNAELIEIPFMLVIIFSASQWIARKSATVRQALFVGLLALAMLLCAEVGLAALLLGKSPADALFNKDPVSGSAYYASLVVFAVLPCIMRHIHKSVDSTKSKKVS